MSRPVTIGLMGEPNIEKFMNTDEIFKRLRIGLALVVGYLAGKGLGQLMGHHPSEFFVVGFGAGVILTQGAFWLWDRRGHRPE